MPDDDEGLNRWDCPGIYKIGDQVIWDGEAEYLGVDPLTTSPVPEELEDVGGPEDQGPDVDFPGVEPGPAAKRRAARRAAGR